MAYIISISGIVLILTTILTILAFFLFRYSEISRKIAWFVVLEIIAMILFNGLEITKFILPSVIFIDFIFTGLFGILAVVTIIHVIFIHNYFLEIIKEEIRLDKIEKLNQKLDVFLKSKENAG